MPLIKAKSRASEFVQYRLEAGEDLLVGKGVKVESWDDDAIVAEAGAHTITLAGTVVGDGTGINILNGGSSLSTIIVEKSGTLIGMNNEAANFEGQRAKLVNKGQIIADEGISFYWGEMSNGTAQVINSGTMTFTDYGIATTANIRLTVKNTGIMNAIDESLIVSGDLRDVFINKGEAYGYVSLSGGNDLYDGRGGKLFGGVYGGVADDTFRPGETAEYLEGDDGFDLVDYSASKAVVLYLDGNQFGRKAAGGDILYEIEHAIGSAKGSDKIYGNYDTVTHERLEGLGGKDSLYGGGGNDTLIGGAGRDLIDAGALDSAVDYIIFNAASEGGDRVLNFATNDFIAFSREGFGINLPLEHVDASRFHKGTTNKAQDAGDRFVFRTTDNTLWFDKDGSKAKFAPVLIATIEGAGFFDQDNLYIV